MNSKFAIALRFGRASIISGVTLLLTVVFLSARVEAEHGMPGYAVVFAKNVPPPTNTLIPLAGSNGVPFSMANLKQGRIRAVEKGGDDVVFLDVADKYDDMEGHTVPFPEDGGGYGENLILLSARRALKAGATYSLQADLDPADPAASPYVLYEFTVGGAAKQDGPTWRSAPFLRASNDEDDEISFREHPSLTPTIVTAVEGFSNQPGFVVVDLLPLDKGARKKRMIATIEPMDPATGKSPCGQVAVFDHEFNVHADDTGRDVGRRYRARLTAMDIAGNSMSAPSAGVDIVWNTWLRVCNDPREKPAGIYETPSPRWTGLPTHGPAADPDISGIARFDNLSPYFERIELPVAANTSLFAEVLLSRAGQKNKRPLRFIAKLSPPDGERQNAAGTPLGCATADIVNSDRDRLLSGPDTRWDARISLTDPYGRRLPHTGPPLSFRLSPLRMRVCTQRGRQSAAAAPTDAAASPPKTSLKWTSFPLLREKGYTPDLAESDLLLVDLAADGPVYLRVTARSANPKARGKQYKLFAMIDPRGAPSGVVKHGCARLQTDPVYPDSSEADVQMWAEIRAMGAVRLEITAMDPSGQTAAAPGSVVWRHPERHFAICTAAAVNSVKSAF